MKRRCTQKNTLLQVIQVENGKFLCKASENCNYKQDTLMPGNFKRHIFKMHQDVYAAMDLPAPPTEKAAEPAKKKSRKLPVETNRETVLLGTLQLATVNHLPHSFPEMKGFKTLVGPLYDATGITANRKTVAGLVDNSACIARQLISAEFKQQPLITIEVDGASRGSRHFVGISARIIIDYKVVVRNLAIKETQERQTKENLKTLIENVLGDFEVKLHQVYAVTHDNGANMVASVSEMKKSLEKPNIDLKFLTDQSFEDTCDEDIDRPDTVDGADEQIEADDADSEADDEDDDFNNGKDGRNETTETPPVSTDPFDASMQDILGSVRCAAHTAQLAVWDVIKPYEKRIRKIQKLVIKLRQTEYHKFVKQHDAHLPPISNKTRWNSTYLMLKSLLKQKQFFSMLKKAYPEIDFSPHWKFIERFCEAFEAPFVLTMQLQKRHVVLSDFYAYWLVCQAKLIRLKENCLAQRLLEACQRRLQKLTESNQFKACAYLDPRFNFLGSKRISSKNKELVQEFLIKLHGCVNRKIDQTVDAPSIHTDEDDLETILAGFFDEDSQGSSSLTSNTSFAQKLKQLETREKVSIIETSRPGPSTIYEKPVHFDLLAYWEGQKFTSPELCRVAMIVLSASATQVSVERGFSALKLMLSDQRMNLTAGAIENALLLKLNPDILPRIVASIDGDHI
ncbi:uncharacterized protein LOC135703371 [Ochlerotatus camptorhynchus]|uniref:uncharacterized protein LOC135703371 n=1 Tax=Ochlerotatus camptorhynchus TaxID=644619 RepID=UPI0031E0A462